MKKKRIILTIGSIIFVCLAAILTYVWPMFSMTPQATGQIPGTDILVAGTRQNSIYFLPLEAGGYIAIDAGSDAAQVEAEMNTVGILPEDVQAVLLTHTDSDHVAALELFENAEIYLKQEEEQMINGHTKRFLFASNSLPGNTYDKGLATLSGEGEFQIGEYMIETIHCPGHTPGSVSYLVDGRYLFTGDSVRITEQKMQVHPYSMNKKTALATIDKLKELDTVQEAEYMFTAHYGYFSISDLLK